MTRRTGFLLLALVALIAMASCILSVTASRTPYPQSGQFADGKFRNPVVLREPGFAKTVGILWRFLFDKPADTAPAQPIPVQALTKAQLLAAPDLSLFRLGHSTMLLKLDGRFWLTDPVFSERA